MALTNLERSVANVKELRYSFVLSKAAQGKADDMASRHYFAHAYADEPFYRFLQAEKINYSKAGENLATNFLSASVMVDAWLNSPGHRQNLLNKDYTEIGIGIAKDGDHWVVAQEFTAPAPKVAENAKFGAASWYSYTIGNYDSSTHLVAAARDFPRKSQVLVTNLDNGKQVTVLITDFGPAKDIHPGRILDLSPKAFETIADGDKSIGILHNIRAELVK